MTDEAPSDLASLLYADLKVSGARTAGEAKAALLESMRSLQGPLQVEVGEFTEEDRRLRRTPEFRVTPPHLPGKI